jgi:hypothetical protein
MQVVLELQYLARGFRMSTHRSTLASTFDNGNAPRGLQLQAPAA